MKKTKQNWKSVQSRPKSRSQCYCSMTQYWLLYLGSFYTNASLRITAHLIGASASFCKVQNNRLASMPVSQSQCSSLLPRLVCPPVLAHPVDELEGLAAPLELSPVAPEAPPAAPLSSSSLLFRRLCPWHRRPLLARDSSSLASLLEQDVERRERCTFVGVTAKKETLRMSLLKSIIAENVLHAQIYTRCNFYTDTFTNNG